MEQLSFRRLAIGTAICVVVALLIWFLLPLLAVSGKHPFDPVWLRVLLVVFVFAGFGGYEFWRIWRQRAQGARLVDEIEKSAAQEAEALGKQFAEAMATLRSAKFGRGSGVAAVYQLPWYVIIGAPGSGKTTALLRSGLRFPLAKAGKTATALSGVGGTRNCEWWFTDQAVMIDTAGRYTTQDANERIDSAAWRTFLDLLKRSRPRQPINGILVTLSVGDLFGWSADERQEYAEIVRARIDEIQDRLGLTFPVYVLVTKTDLVAGFHEFFASLDSEQRAQIWGMTFGYDVGARRPTEDAREAFVREYQSLVERLSLQTLLRLQEETDVERRRAFYAFAQQISALGPLISAFMGGAFAASDLRQSAVVRGVYFTSGTQDGSSFDRVVSAVASSVGLHGSTSAQRRHSGSEKAFFIRSLLTDVVFREAALASFNEKRENLLKRSVFGALGVASLASVVLVSGMAISYFQNEEGLERATAKAAVAAQLLGEVGQPDYSGADLPQLIDALNSLRLVPSGVHDPVAQPPMKMRFGLYQGSSLLDRTEERYRAALIQGLLPRVAMQLEATMLDPGSTGEAVYSALKTYLMLYEPAHMNTEGFVASVARRWADQYGDDVAAQMRPHLVALAGTAQADVSRFHERNVAAVTAAREKVSELELVERAYGRLIEAVEVLPEARAIRWTELVGQAGLRVFERPPQEASGRFAIRYAFTRDGYRDGVKPLIASIVDEVAGEEDWVLGERSSGNAADGREENVSAVLGMYMDAYMRTWDEVIAGARIRTPKDMVDAQLLASALARSESPLKRLLQRVDAETRLSKAGPASALAAKAAEKAMQRVQQESRGLAAPTLTALTSRVFKQKEEEVERHFADVHEMIGAPGQPGRFDEAREMFKEVADALAQVGPGSRELPPALRLAGAQAADLPAPVKNAVAAIASTGQSGAIQGIRQELRSGIGGAAALCQRLVPGRYPFLRRSGAEDIPVKDFVNVFRSGGELDAFFMANLEARTDRSGGAWVPRDTNPDAPSVATLAQFQNADAIRQAFLAGGGSPLVDAEIELVSAPASVVVDYAGNERTLRPGESMSLRWPAAGGAGGLRLSVDGAEIVRTSGAWALFRWVDAGAPVTAGRTAMRVTYGSPGGPVTFVVRADSSLNPFRLPELARFRCPSA